MKKGIIILTVLILSLCIFSNYAYADVGPKPSLDIVVKGIDTQNYWLDLLVTDEADYSWLEISKEEREKVSKLAEYRDEEGYHPALLGGTNVPLNGKLTGVKQDDGSYIHKFSYLGVPTEFKIAILKDDGTLIISDTVTRKQFQSVMVYDLNDYSIAEETAGEVTEKIPWLNMSLGFVIRLILTLAIEIAIALIFGFTIKNSLKVLLITNTITQVILNIIIFFVTSSSGLFAGIFVFIIAEIIVILTELLVYSRLLTEKSMMRRAVYTITANIVSMAAGFLIFFIS